MILMLAPGPNMVFGTAPSGASYVSDRFSLIGIANDSTDDQTYLAGAGCYTLSPFGGWGTFGFTTLADLYAADAATGLVLPGQVGFPQHTYVDVTDDDENTGAWLKTGGGAGAGNWTQKTTITALGAAASAAYAAKSAKLAAGFDLRADLLDYAPQMAEGDQTEVSSADAGTHAAAAGEFALDGAPATPGDAIPNAGRYTLVAGDALRTGSLDSQVAAGIVEPIAPLRTRVDAAYAGLSRWEVVAPASLHVGTYYRSDTGAAVSLATRDAKVYACDGGDTFAASTTISGTNMALVVFFDAGGAIILPSYIAATSTYTQYKRQIFTTPANARSFAVCGWNTGLITGGGVPLYVEKPSAMSTTVAPDVDQLATDRNSMRTFVDLVANGEVSWIASTFFFQGTGVANANAAYIGARVPVSPGDVLRLKLWTNSANSAAVIFMTANEGYLSQTWVGTGTLTNVNGTVTVPANAAYAYITSRTDYQATSTIEISRVENGLVADLKDSRNKLKSFADLVASGEMSWSPGIYFQVADGTSNSNASYIGAKIPAQMGDQFQISLWSNSPSSSPVIFLNAGGGVISYAPVGTGTLTNVTGTYTAPAGTAFVCFTSRSAQQAQSSVARWQIESGVVANLKSRMSAVESKVKAQGATLAYSYNQANGTAFPTADPADPVDYMFLGKGQSWMQGDNNGSSGNATITASAQHAGYALMPAPGVRPNGAAFTSYADLKEAYDSATGGYETPLSGMADVIMTRLNARLGFKPRIIFANACKGGQAYWDTNSGATGLKRGTTIYAEALRVVQSCRDISAALGRRLVVLAQVVAHGEADWGNGLSKELYQRALDQWNAHFNEDIRRITGQVEPVRMYVTQCQRGGSTIGNPAGTALAQLAAQERNTLIRCVGPVYQGPGGQPGDGNDGAHLRPLGWRMIGRLLGHFAVEDMFGPYQEPLRVVDKWWISATQAALKYSKPISVETTNALINVLDITASGITYAGLGADGGVKFTDGSGSPPTVTGVSVSGGDTLVVTLSGAPAGKNPRLTIAGYRPGGIGCGAERGARSAIRSTTAFDTDALTGVTQYHWACQEQVVLPVI